LSTDLSNNAKANSKMDPNKLFEDLTWADLTIVEDELKAV